MKKTNKVDLNKLFNNLTREELLYLLSLHRSQLYTKIIHRRLAEIEKINYTINFNEIQNISILILCKLGLDRCPIYKEEIESLIKRLSDVLSNRRVYGRISTHLAVTQEDISFSIVSEILKHYNVNYNEQDILSQFNINPNSYSKTKIVIRNLCKKYYWLSD